MGSPTIKAIITYLPDWKNYTLTVSADELPQIYAHLSAFPPKVYIGETLILNDIRRIKPRTVYVLTNHKPIAFARVFGRFYPESGRFKSDSGDRAQGIRSKEIIEREFEAVYGRASAMLIRPGSWDKCGDVLYWYYAGGSTVPVLEIQGHKEMPLDALKEVAHIIQTRGRIAIYKSERLDYVEPLKNPWMIGFTKVNGGYNGEEFIKQSGQVLVEADKKSGLIETLQLMNYQIIINTPLARYYGSLFSVS